MNKIFYKQNILKVSPEKWVPTGEVVLTNLKTADGICQCKHKASNAEEIEGDNFIEYNKFGVFNGSHLIENAYRLFWCSPVKEATGYFPKLKYGIELFGRCNKLEKINAPYFPLLEDGKEGGILEIGTNLIPGDTTSEDYIKVEEAKTTLTNKGWSVSLQYNGGVSGKSTNLIYAKIESAENGLYVTSSGERVSFYWGHEISNPSDATWKIFSSVEEAKEAFGITEVED